MTTTRRLAKLADDCRTLARSAGTSRDRRELISIAEHYDREAETQARRTGVQWPPVPCPTSTILPR
jgi:hypothetical protein